MQYAKQVCHWEPMTGFGASLGICQTCYVRWWITGHIPELLSRLFLPTALAVPGPGTLSFEGHGFDFLESYQDNYPVFKIMTISEILKILHCDSVIGGFRMPTR